MPPRAVVIPFGVPQDGQGLGLGLAALVHSFARLEGEGLALAQLHGRRADEPEATTPGPVEALVPPQAWRDLAGAGHAPPDVTVVVTGAFEPPSEGRGLIQLIAFNAKDGSMRAKVEAHLDGSHAGKTIIAAFDELWQGVGGGELGVVRDIEDLAWEPLESVLRAERCALHDPTRGGPHDRLAAMMHLGRAVEEAPNARFPAGRLAALALDAATFAGDAKLAEAARRALARAIHDAPSRVELLEATAALELRVGNADAAETHLAQALVLSKERPRTHALLSEARRARKQLDGALDAVHAGLAYAPDDPMLLTERGAVLLERGDEAAGEADLRRAMDLSPLFPSAFLALASLTLKRNDARAAEELVDLALLVQDAHPEVLKKAVHLSLTMEPDGLPRAARLSRLGRTLVDKLPFDPWCHFVLARAEAQLGAKEAAAELLANVEHIAKGSAIAAEAQRGRFTLKEPQAAQEVESLLRAAYSAPATDLEALAARGRRLAMAHGVWSAHFALGVVEGRREKWLAARTAFEEAIQASAGCTPAHLELVAVAVALKDVEAALRYAASAKELEGETARTLAVQATALFAAGRDDEALSTMGRAQALDPEDAACRALADRIRARSTPPTGPVERVRDVLARWFK